MVAWAPCWALELASYKEEALALSFVLSKTFLPVRVSLRFRRLTVLTTKLNQGAAGADHKGLVLDPLVWLPPPLSPCPLTSPVSTPTPGRCVVSFILSLSKVMREVFK